MQQTLGGRRGAPGSNGPSGDAGLNAYCSIPLTSTQPAVGSTIDVRPSPSTTYEWAIVGQVVFLFAGGYYEVMVPNVAGRITIKNLGYTGNAAPGASVGGGYLGPAGLVGPTGAANISGSTGKLVKFTDASTGGDSIVSESGAAITVSGAHEVTGRATQRTTQGGGWKDLLGPLTPPNVGGTIPVVTQVAASPISLPLWQLNDKMWAVYHVGHDYAVGTQVYFHVHWLTDAVQTRTVKWQITFYCARGYNVEAFALGGAGTVITIEQAAAGVAYQHMISESTAQTIANMEPDGYILAEIKRIANGGTDNTDGVFAWNADVHYQSIENTTANRNGPWGT